MPLPVQKLFLLSLFPEKLSHLIDRALRSRIIEELHDQLETHHLVFLPAPVPSALLKLRPRAPLLILSLSELQLMQQILKTLLFFLYRIVGRLVVVPDPVYVRQEFRQDFRGLFYLSTHFLSFFMIVPFTYRSQSSTVHPRLWPAISI